MKMRICIAIFVCLWLTGCANSPYGNFSEHSTPVINQQLASATVRQMAAVYPPASTRLLIAQDVVDGYGIALVRGLRAAGYSVQELAPKTNTVEKPGSGSTSLAVNYIIDSSKDINLYRVTLLVGRQSLSRAYAIENDRLQAMGAWVYRE